MLQLVPVYTDTCSLLYVVTHGLYQLLLAACICCYSQPVSAATRSVLYASTVKHTCFPIHLHPHAATQDMKKEGQLLLIKEWRGEERRLELEARMHASITRLYTSEIDEFKIRT
jgi:hypothetical protein